MDEAINQWRDGFFISTYDEKISAVRQGKLNMDSQELEDVYNEETYLQKEGKTGLVADFLYNSIAQYGFINEHHRDAIESAWMFHDMEFLQQQWEYYALAQIRSLRAVIVSMLGTVPTIPETEPQNAKREPKRIEDYPEVFDITLCSELKIQCKLPPKTKRFCPLKTFNNAPLKSLDRWGYYYFSLFPSVCTILRTLSPVSSIRCAVCIIRSIMASATVGLRLHHTNCPLAVAR